MLADESRYVRFDAQSHLRPNVGPITAKPKFILNPSESY